MIIIDGLPFTEKDYEPLKDLKQLAAKLSLPIWFSVRTHRHEDVESTGIPVVFNHVADLFEVLIALQPEGEAIHVRILKGGASIEKHRDLQLDPATMLITDISEKAAAV